MALKIVSVPVNGVTMKYKVNIDIVERLRAADYSARWPLLEEAADEIERLQAENERLQAIITTAVEPEL